MNQHFQTILNFIQQSEHLSDEEKTALLKAAKDANKELEITTFKLDRTEKVKRTTAILLEETIEELENKRKAVEAQNKELEIESSLERVRTVALSMNKPDDMLDICSTITHQLQLLDVKEIRNVQTAIFYEDKGTYMNYEYYAKHDKTFITETSYTNHEIHNAFANQMLKGSGEFYVTHIKDDAVKDWIAYQKTTNVFIDDYLNTATSLNYYWYSLGPVALGISTYEPLKEEETDLFKRFLKVFELSYTRYLDIEQAIAQAREAQIQLALERIRARTMAMQKSDELAEAALLLFEQLQSLGAVLWSCGFNIFEKDDTECTSFIARGGKMLEPVKLSLNENMFMQLFHESKQNGEELWSMELSGEDSKSVFGYVAKQRQLQTGNVTFLSEVTLPSSQIVHLVNFAHGNLMFITVEPHPEMHDIFKRFGKVFEQTYTRFLDLQKAEAQSRESQIQLALERVRARTMAMQKSNELSETAYILFQQFKDLGEDPIQITIGIFNEDEKVVQFSITGFDGSGSQIDQAYNMDIDEPILLHKIYTAWKEQKKSVVIELAGKDLNDWSAYRSKIAKLTESVTFSADDRRFVSVGFFSKGMISFSKPDRIREETIKILERFASVFEQTYTRFLDLQKAEEQARESQIQLALERVRARTMAMQKQNDLLGVLDLLVEQLVKLGVDLQVANFSKGLPGGDWDLWIEVVTDVGTIFNNYVHFPRIDHPYFHHVEKNIETFRNDGTDFFKDVFSKEEKNSWQDYIYTQTIYKDLTSEEIKQSIYDKPGYTWSMVILKDTWVSICRFNQTPFSDEEDALLRRFANAFGQAYTRFLDLQKAEAQAREAQIELGLERVRARAMAMQTSEELNALIGIVFTELTKLDLVLTRCVIIIYDAETKGAQWWMANSEAPSAPMNFFVKYADLSFFNVYLKGWEERDLKWQYILEGENKIVTDNFLFNETELKTLPDFVIEGMKAPHKVYLNASFNNFGNLTLATLEPLSEKHFDILLRFAKVFDLTYTRFNDLQKAEAQTREAQIQLALERVRAKTMAMHSSEDVTSATETMFDELKKLGINNIRGGIANIHPEKTMDVFGITNMIDGKTMKGFTLFDTNEHPIWQRLFESWNNKDEVFIDYLAGQEKEDYINVINSHQNYLPKSIVEFPDTHFQSYRFDQGNIWTYSLQPHSESDREIMKRFASGFALTFRRYQDLKQAEAQAREAQIEAALERVRARTMAMFKSDELAETAVVVFQQLISLGIEPNRLYIGIINDESGDLEFWMTDEEGKQVSKRYVVNIHQNISIKKMYEGWKEQQQALSVDMSGNELHEWITYWNKEFDVPFKQGSGHQRRVQNLAYFSKGFIATTTFENASKETVSLLNRFAAVFNLTYTRFNDLQLAEAQAREATIEAALEKVRGKAMAMHNSNDLSVTASLVFTELRKLGISPIRCGVGLFNKESKKTQLYSATPSPDGDSLSLVGWVIMTEHPVLEKIYESWLNNEEYYPELQGEQLRSYYQQLLRGVPVAMPNIDTGKKQFGHFFPFSIGCLNTWSDHPHSESEIKILRRFATIIDLTFRRYLELQKSETNAREAVKQAAVDRIRADIASMRTISDLDRITPLIWNELTILGINFIRCGVFIMDDSQKVIHTFLSTPDGKAIAAFHLPYSTPGNIQKVISHWHDNKNYIDHWNESDFTQFAEMLVQQKALSSAEEYLKTIPHDGFYLHFLPFLQGMLYVGNTSKLNEDEINLIQSVADAFSTAYARYEDFNKLEAAKQQVEVTLSELKQAQQQLVQSEKMASLGELTAGIAHEIQNPLNFVNNFSEVNKEMLEELKGERLKPNAERDENLEVDIINDVIANEEKINHHGKRADAIVKGMLQHSRKSEGKKESTDINALCDEYLRLSYHGLRAKDKSFNADFKTDFDTTIGNINIIPQDIARVLLNLYNNAFYATNEKQKAESLRPNTEYKPTVSVQTKKLDNNIEISVNDNGNGIPSSIKEKIFQPFFTTKPTGQGTGLGLSLSYDIIKAHGGEIKIEGKEGEGSEFIIILPLT